MNIPAESISIGRGGDIVAADRDGDLIYQRTLAVVKVGDEYLPLEDYLRAMEDRIVARVLSRDNERT